MDHLRTAVETMKKWSMFQLSALYSCTTVRHIPLTINLQWIVAYPWYAGYQISGALRSPNIKENGAQLRQTSHGVSEGIWHGFASWPLNCAFKIADASTYLMISRIILIDFSTTLSEKSSTLRERLAIEPCGPAAWGI